MQTTPRKLIIATKRFIKPPIIQFGPPRTGSTLLWNLLRTAYPRKKVLKQHSLASYEKSALCRSKIIASIRNPLDAISSSIQRYELKPTAKVIERQLDEFERNGIWDLYELRNNSRAIVLKYEDFAFNWGHAFQQIEKFLKEEISDEKKQKCLELYSIDVVKKKATALGNFSNYDRENHIHGKHISEFSGRIGYYSEYLDDDMISKIHARFAPIFSAFNYMITKEEPKK